MLGRRGVGGWCARALFIGLAVVTALGACAGKSGSSNADAGQGGDDTSGPMIAQNVVFLRESAVNKIDLLLTVDNSSSMKDKQELLAQALPLLVSRLVTPRCMRPCTAADNCTPRQEAEGIPIGANADAAGACPAGAVSEMPPLRDLHLAVISSSLGAHGASGPKDLCTKPSDDDHAHLLGQVRQVPGTFQNQGFLAWDVNRDAASGADSDPKAFLDKALALVDSAGENGCELESTLEAWYRFLIDPEPPQSVVVAAGSSAAIVQGVDETVLQQRAAFLRPDSAVVIGMLSDENDCSVVDEGYGWLTARSAAMYGATSACANNPNDPCCQSCGEATANPGCPSIATDPACASQTLAAADDAPNLRCWHQKSRFGFDLLYPISRYFEGLNSATVNQRSTGMRVQNPLFAAADGSAPRDRGLVQVFGIIGVPWQDIADSESLSPGSPSLRFLSGSELSIFDRWPVVLGDAETNPPTPPSDPLMVEAIAERNGANPITQDPLVPSTAKSPNANVINGHEHANVDQNDLQYACTFKLKTPRACDAAAKAAGTGCDCFEEDATALRPLCQSATDGTIGTTQYYAKAYPGTRFLQLFEQLENPVVASVCPKIMDQASPDYGYNPAINGLMQSVRGMFRSRCLPVPLPIDDMGQVDNCGVVTTYQRSGGSCDCESHGWFELTGGPGVDSARTALKSSQACGVPGAPACSDFCFCQIPQLEGADLQACQVDNAPPRANGFCYINAQPNEPNVGNPDLVRDCSADAHRHLRFVGEAPSPSAASFIVCAKPLVAPKPAAP